MNRTTSVVLGRAKFAAPVPGADIYWNGNGEKVYRAAAAVDSHLNELTHTVDLIQRAHDGTSIRVLAKTYLIGWVTLSDVVAGLLNEVFDLGYAERDVSLSVVLRNKHVRSV